MGEVKKRLLSRFLRSYNEQAPVVAYPFIWSSPDSPYLTELSEKYSLAEKVAGCERIMIMIKKRLVCPGGVNSGNIMGVNTPHRSKVILFRSRKGICFFKLRNQGINKLFDGENFIDPVGVMAGKGKAHI